METDKLYTIKEAVNYGASLLKESGIENAEYDSFALLSEILKIDRTFYLIHGNTMVKSDDFLSFEKYIERRSHHEPLQHILGKAWFYGREFIVNGNVLVPRPDTEILIEQALKELDMYCCRKEALHNANTAGGVGASEYGVTGNSVDALAHSADNAAERVSILDMCTGSGCIALTLALERSFTQVAAVDVSEAALEVARLNQKQLKVSNVEFLKSDLFDELDKYKHEDKRFDMLVSNPPYIETKEIEKLSEEVRLYDPLMALDGYEDGLYFYRIITQQAIHFLQNGGWLIYEIGYNQGRVVSGLMKAAGFVDVSVVKDYAGLDRVVKGRLFFRQGEP